MDHLDKLKTPIIAADPMVESMRELIADREGTVSRLRNDLASLEVEDTHDFLNIDSPEAAERRVQRVRLNAELQQATASLEGAREFLAKREAMFMYRSVRALRGEIEADLQKAMVAAREVSECNEQSARKLNEFLALTGGIAAKMRETRGRNLLTKDGHLARASITDIANGENVTFWVVRHFSGLVGWRTQWEPGPPFAQSAGGAVAQANTTIQTLLGDECFDPQVVAAVQAEDKMRSGVALAD